MPAKVTLASLLIVVSMGCAEPSLKSVATTPYMVTVVVASIPLQLTVTATDTRGNEKDVTAVSTYKSSNEKVARVTADGGVEGLFAGYCNVTVSYTEGKITRTDVVPVSVIWNRTEGLR